MRPARLELAILLPPLIWAGSACASSAPTSEKVSADDRRAGQTTGTGRDSLNIVFSEKAAPGGIDRTLTIHGAGRLDLKPGDFEVEQIHLSPRELDPVRAMVQDPSFAVLRSRYISKLGEDELTLPTDSLLYHITVSSRDVTRQVATDGGPGQPAILTRLINELTRLRRLVEEEGT